MKGTYNDKILEREKQIKEENERMARQLADDKENYNFLQEVRNVDDFSSSKSSSSYN